MTELAAVPRGTYQRNTFRIEKNINVCEIIWPTGSFLIRHIGPELQGSIYAFRDWELGFRIRDSGVREEIIIIALRFPRHTARSLIPGPQFPCKEL